MSVVKVRQVDAELGHEKYFTGRRVYEVDTDDLIDDESTALTASDGTDSIPGKGDEWTADHPAVVVRRTARRLNREQFTFEVTVEYSSEPARVGSASQADNPLNRGNSYEYGDEMVTEPYFEDETTPTPKRVVNTNGKPFASDPTRERVVGTITITRNVADFDDENVRNWRNKINDDNVTIRGIQYAADRLRVLSWTGSGPMEENGVTYWTERIRLGIKMDGNGWTDEFTCFDHEQLINGELKDIKNADGDPVTKPYPLAENGSAAATPETKAHVLEFRPYRKASFSGWNL